MKREIPKRLTEYIDGEARMVNSHAFGHREIYKKLAAYEDIGLEPEDIALKLRELERLKAQISRINDLSRRARVNRRKEEQ